MVFFCFLLGLLVFGGWLLLTPPLRPSPVVAVVVTVAVVVRVAVAAMVAVAVVTNVKK